MRRSKHVDVTGEVFEVPRETKKSTAAWSTSLTGRIGVDRRFVRAVAHDHPEVSLGRAERHGVPVDEQPALTGPHHVAGVRLSVGDHPLARRARPRSETVGQRRAARPRSDACRASACRAGSENGPPTHVWSSSSECRFELPATGQIEDELPRRGNRGRRPVELGEHRDDGGALGGVVLAEHTRLVRPRTGRARSCGAARAAAPSRRCSWGSARPRSPGRCRGGRPRCRTRAAGRRTPRPACRRARASVEVVDGDEARVPSRSRRPPSGSCRRRRAHTRRVDLEAPVIGRAPITSLVSISSGSALTAASY